MSETFQFTVVTRCPCTTARESHAAGARTVSIHCCDEVPLHLTNRGNGWVIRPEFQFTVVTRCPCTRTACVAAAARAAFQFTVVTRCPCTYGPKRPFSVVEIEFQFTVVTRCPCTLTDATKKLLTVVVSIHCCDEVPLHQAVIEWTAFTGVSIHCCDEVPLHQKQKGVTYVHRHRFNSLL